MKEWISWQDLSLTMKLPRNWENWNLSCGVIPNYSQKRHLKVEFEQRHHRMVSNSKCPQMSRDILIWFPFSSSGFFIEIQVSFYVSRPLDNQPKEKKSRTSCQNKHFRWWKEMKQLRVSEEEEKLIGLPFHFVNSLWKLNINNPGRVSCWLCKTLYVVRKNLCSIRSLAACRDYICSPIFNFFF